MCGSNTASSPKSGFSRKRSTRHGEAPQYFGCKTSGDAFGARLGSGEGLRWALVCLVVISLITSYLFRDAARTFREDTVG